MTKLKQGLIYLLMASLALAAGFFMRAQLMESDKSAFLSSEVSKQGAEAIFAATLPDIQGENQSISQWKGKVLVVNFWATWCAPCREEIPEFIEMQEKYQDQELIFIGIAIDRKEKVVAYSDEFGINYPVLIENPRGESLLEVTGNPQSALPYTIVINRNGEIVETFLGRVKQEKLEKTLSPLLKESPINSES